MNDIGDDVFKVIYGHGESVSWRLRLCRNGSHWLDSLSVSNSSSRNWNSYSVAMIASLNIVVKTFTKIAKTFAGLSATIIAKRRRPVLILHLVAKSAKIELQKWNLCEKLGKEHLDSKKSTQKKSTLMMLAWWRNRWLSVDVLLTQALMMWLDDITKADVA